MDPERAKSVRQRKKILNDLMHGILKIKYPNSTKETKFVVTRGRWMVGLEELVEGGQKTQAFHYKINKY